MEDTIYYNRKQPEFQVFVAAFFTDLERLKKEEDITSLNALVLKIIPEMKWYCPNYLHQCVKFLNFLPNINLVWRKSQKYANIKSEKQKRLQRLSKKA